MSATLRNDVADSGSLPCSASPRRPPTYPPPAPSPRKSRANTPQWLTTSSSPPDPSPALSPTAITGTIGFKKYVLAYLNNEPELYLHLYLRRSENVALFRFCGVVFTIRTTDYLLDQPEHADYFLPLGWLVENGNTTRYVCLLNISSSPMSVWLMYDYVFVDDEDDDVVELENTKMIYDGYLDGGTPETMMKTKELVEEQDMFLLYRDIADWDPKKPKAGPNPATKAGKSRCSLGPSARAVTRKPPRDLLDAITTPAQGPLPSKIIEHWY
ncbi:MAG: hypothetical protein LQ338_006701 [Usnochroma carphineum]|nr:MAG: hypothetical protein LQ338_006701 [Usnochroma carphineum]